MNQERMRSVLETLARAFTERNDLSVAWGINPCTDFEKIYLPRRDKIVPGVECSPGELWLSLKASCAHEAGHLIFTDKRVWDGFRERGPLYRHLLNIVEDARVERSMSNLFPGTLRWFRFSNEYIFLNRRDWVEMAPPDQALYGLICYAVVGRIPEGLSESIVKFVLECASFVDEGRTSETTEGAAGAAEKIAKIFIEYYGEHIPTVLITFSPENHGTLDPRKPPRGNRDPRRKPILPKIESKPKAELETDTESDKKVAPKDEPGETEDEAPRPVEDAVKNGKPDAEPDNDTGPDEAEDDELDGDFSFGEDTRAEDKPDIEPNDAEKSDSSPEEDALDPDNKEGSPGECNAGEEVPEDGEFVSERDREAGSDDPETGDSDGDLEENPDEEFDDSFDEELDDLSDEEFDDSFDEEFDDSYDEEPYSFSDFETKDPGALDEPGGSENSGETRSGEEFSPGEGIPSGDGVKENGEPEPDNTEEESPEEELLTGMDDLIKESEAETKSFRDEPPEKPAPEYSREEVEEAARAGMKKCRLVVQALPPDPKRREHYERILNPLAHKAAEEVRKILEGRHSTVRRNLRKGALDPSALWKVPVKEPDIFMKRDLPGQKADLAVYLLIDCSASMSISAEGRWPDCKCRMDYAAYAAILLHLMCRELNIPHAATGFTTIYEWREEVLHLVVKKFSERDGSFERLFEISGIMLNNVDGYSIRAAAKELSIRPEKKKVLFVISDGLPCAYGYDGPPAFKDTALAVRETERSGIGVIGIYIGESDSTVKLLYPNLIMLSAGDLPVVLARTLKKVITGPA